MVIMKRSNEHNLALSGLFALFILLTVSILVVVLA